MLIERPVPCCPKNTITSKTRRSARIAIIFAVVALLTSGIVAAQVSIQTSGDISTQGKLVSKDPAGPPLQVSSSQLVANLNADQLDGLDAASFALTADLANVSTLVSMLQVTIDDQAALIAQLHPKLVLHNSRFRAWVTFLDSGVSRPAEAVPVGASDDQGYFFFRRDFYIDVYMKILDGRAINSHWWVFLTSLTELEYTLTVLDTETGALATYSNPAGTRNTFKDTTAFADSGGYPVTVAPEPEERSGRIRSEALASCVSSPTTMCLIGNRFEVAVTWSDPISGGGVGQVANEPLTSHAGAFWFYAPSSLENIVSIVETPPVFVVNFGSFTDVAYAVTVTDTCTGYSVQYGSPQGEITIFGDNTSFPNVPCLP